MPRRVVQGVVEAAAAMCQAAFTWAEARQFTLTHRHHPHQFEELGDMLTASGLSQQDITTRAQHGANWRIYLAYYPDARNSIGNGVYRFEVPWSDACDAHKQQHRVAFLVVKVDGTDVCLQSGIKWLSEVWQVARPPPASLAPIVARGYHDY